LPDLNFFLDGDKLLDLALDDEKTLVARLSVPEHGRLLVKPLYC